MDNKVTNKQTQSTQFSRQPWEPAGVINELENNQTPNYGKHQASDDKGGLLNLEVEQVFHNAGIMGKKGIKE